MFNFSLNNGLWTRSGGTDNYPAQFKPLQWHDARDEGAFPDGNNVATWLDRSGRGNTTIQSIGASQPTRTLDYINGHPAVVLNGGVFLNTQLTLSLMAGGDFTLFTVIKKAGAVVPDYVVSQAKTLTTPSYSSSFIHFSDVSSTHKLAWMRTVTAGDSSLFGNDEVIISSTAWDMSEATFSVRSNRQAKQTSGIVAVEGSEGSVKIGARGDGTTSFFTGALGEYILLRKLITDTQMDGMFEYFANGWGATLYV